MSKLNVTKMFNTVVKTVSKHSPEILTGIGVAGMVTTTVLAVKATPKALQLIEKAEDHGIGITPKEDPNWEYRKLTATEAVKVAWKPYLPAIVTGVCSVACIVGGSTVSLKRNAALVTAYQVSNTALKEYKDKVVELVDPEKVQEIDTKIAEDRANKKIEEYRASGHNIIISGDSKLKVSDGMYGGKTTASPIDIEKAFIDLNWKLLSEDYASLNDLYDLLGMERTDAGEELGWNTRKVRRIEPYYDSKLDPDNTPVLVIRYNHAPERGYESAW